MDTGRTRREKIVETIGWWPFWLWEKGGTIIKEMELNPFFSKSLKRLKKSSPLSILTSFHMLQMPEISSSVKDALKIEYRVTSRAQEFADFQEGIRAMIIDKDKSPLWKYPKIDQVPIKKVFDLLKPLSFSNELKI